MHRTSMLLSSFFLAATFAATPAQAANSINITSSSCSGTETRSLTGDALFSCSGDYSFLGSSINWDSKVSFFATGNLLFDNFDITVNNLFMKAGGSVTFGRTGTFTVSENFTIESGLGIFGSIPGEQILIPINPLPTPTPDPNSTPGVILIGSPPSNPCALVLGPCNPPANLPKPPSPGGTIVISGSGGIVTTGSGGSGGPISITSPVPEPSTYAMLFAGLLMLAGVTKRRKAKR